MAKKRKENKIPKLLQPPVITVLGHVDHGKTTLLDKIRKTNIASKEKGGITQHIGAYQIEKKGKTITFIDTPGHEAFAKMRARGANVADLAILVVAGNDGVKPQTTESINHIQAAKIPCIVAINKMDLPDINLDKIKKQLAKQGVNLEEFGGESPVVTLSAKTGKGIDNLLDTIILMSELYLQKPKDPDMLEAVVIESILSKYKGSSATVIIRSGKIQNGEELVCENQEFKVRAIHDWKGVKAKTAVLGDPVEILGWNSPPIVGSRVYAKNQLEITKPSEIHIQKEENKTLSVPDKKAIEEEKIKIIIRSDTSGSLEAIENSIQDKADIILSGVGNIKESDVLLAKTTKALIIGFSIEPEKSVKKLASEEKVLIKTYNIIYKLFEELEDVIEAIRKGGLEEELGKAKIIALFDIKGEKVAGVKVLSGRIAKGDKVKIMKNSTLIGKSHIKSLKHHKKDIKKAEKGMEAGIILSKNIDILTGYSIISIG